MKGSLLNEQQVASVTQLLHRSGAIFCASMIDLSTHSAEDISTHRERRCASLSANLTTEHTQELRDNVAALQDRMTNFSDQLYVQSAVTIDLLYHLIENMLTYHCQRFPQELAEFHWIVDAKDSQIVTDYEDWWSKTLVIWLEAMSLQRPGSMLPGGDYRHFRRFVIDQLPEHLQEVAPEVDNTLGAGFNLPLMFRESFRFSSEPEPGLELVDIATNALRRGLIGNLEPDGWLPLRQLMIHRPGTYVRPVRLFSGPDRPIAQSLAANLNRFRMEGRIMSTPALKWPET